MIATKILSVPMAGNRPLPIQTLYAQYSMIAALHWNQMFCKSMLDDSNKNTIKHYGGCHCQSVKFIVKAPANISAIRCNCSICQKSGFLHLIVTAENFNLLKGKEHLTEYRFNTEVARHLFCRKCGIKSFYSPRSHPDSWSVNVNCLEPTNIACITITEFDGRHWEDNIDDIR